MTRPPVILVSPDMRPSVMNVARSLAEAGLLQRFVTTVAVNGVDRPAGWLRRRAKSRAIPPFLSVPVETFPFGEIVRLAVARLGIGDVPASHVWEWAETRFDRRVAAAWAGRAPCLYGCEHASVETFHCQKKKGGRTVLWQVIAHHKAMWALLREEYTRFPDAMSPYIRHLLRATPHVNARKDTQSELADLIVCNSEFVRRTFIDAGRSPNTVVAIPTGCPPVNGRSARLDRDSDGGKMIFLSAGSQSVRKGIPYLLEAWRQLQPNGAELWLVGHMELTARLLRNLPASVRIRPAVPRSELAGIFARASVLVLPSICEGLAHIILEALSAGLAVITTENSGCGSLVEDGVNGWKVPIRSAEALAERMAWCLDNPEAVREMQRRSVERAACWQEQDFARSHAALITDFLVSESPQPA